MLSGTPHSIPTRVYKWLPLVWDEGHPMQTRSCRWQRHGDGALIVKALIWKLVGYLANDAETVILCKIMDVL